MQPVGFPQANLRMVAPEGVSEEDCGPMPVYHDERYSISCWELSGEDLMRILQTKRVWLWIMGTTQPPVILSSETPFERESRDGR